MASKVTPSMWVRRIVSSILLLGVLIGIIIGGVKLYGILHAKLSEQQKQIQLSEQNLPATIRSCGSSELDVTVSPKQSTVLVGEGVTVTVRIVGTSKEACSFNTGDLDLTLSVGEEVVWSPTKCSKTWDRTLLLGDWTSWERDVKWRGNIYSDCEALESGDGSKLIADPGMYKFQATMLGVVLEDLGSLEVEY